jgi:hypothetical protein
MQRRRLVRMVLGCKSKIVWKQKGGRERDARVLYGQGRGKGKWKGERACAAAGSLP